MITINNTKYIVQNIKVTFGNYNVSNKDKRRNGQSPFIQFHTDNDIFIGIETTYDKEWLKELEVNDRKNITEYISDIAYEDENGWLSLITGKYTCYLEKINQSKFRIEFKCAAEECDEYFDISIIEDILVEL